jgi:Bacteriophage tail sheath protein
MRYSRYPYRTPGVYVERADASRVPPVVLRTDITAFVGIAEQGPLDTPVPIESVRQFTAHFGTFIGGGYLAYVVRAFFENGGRRCWVVRVAQRDFSGNEPACNGARSAWIDIADIHGNQALRVSASSAGSWGNGLALEWSLSGAALTTSVPALDARNYAVLRSVAGFAQDELVRIDQPGYPAQLRVIAAVDVAESKLYWVHPDPTRRRPSELPLVPFDAVVPLRITRVAYALAVRRDGAIVANYRDLHLVPTHARYIGTLLRPTVYWASVLRGSALIAHDESDAARDGEPTSVLPRAPEPVVVTPISNADIPHPLDVPLDDALNLAQGMDGLAGLCADDFIGEPVAPNESDFAREVKSRGLQSLALIDEIALVAVPDILIQPDPDPDYLPVPQRPSNPCIPCPPPRPPRAIHQPRASGELPPLFSDDDIARVQAALIESCEDLGDRVALLALPYTLATSVTVPRENIVAWRDRFDSRVAALYAPWVEVAEPRGVTVTRLVPPCGHVAGAIARVDLAAGVQRAPSNVIVSGVVRVARAVDDELHGELNESNVNALRTDFGVGCRVAGARSLALDDQWRYLNVVRLMLTIKKAADIALRWTVFEPNDETLWTSVRATLTAILQLFFERGAFAGDTPEESFYVRCDETTNPPDLREEGQLVALLGFQPAAPCEFIVLRVGRQFAAPAVSLFAAEEVLA